LLEGRSIDGAKPLSSYRDFIELEQGALKSADARKYWEDQLYGAVSEQSFWKGQQKRIEARRVEAILQDELMQGLKLLCVDARASMKYVALAAHISVIGLISGQKDIVTGLVSNGRPETESGEEVLGLFLNTLPLRIQLHGQRWIELVRDVATAEAALLPFRRFPLAEIQRIGGSKPIFETLFNFVHFHVFRELDTIKGIRVTNAGGFEQTNFPFVTTFSLDPLGEKLRLRIDYEGTFIKNEEVDAILNYYLAALHFLANESNRICETGCLLTYKERRQLLVDWNQTERPVPETSLPALFEQQVRRSAEATALVYEEQSLSYGALNERANRLAHLLIGRGVGPEDLVAIALPRSLEMIVALLGILKAGAAYLPLDPDYPAERLAFMLADAQPKLLLCVAQTAADLPPAQCERLLLDDPALATLLQDLPASNPTDLERTHPLLPLHPAYVIYTSGSTGKPKGCIITHHNVLRLFRITEKLFNFGSKDTWTLFHSYAFDFSVWEIWGPLLYGGRLIIVPYVISRSPKDFLDLLVSQKVTVLNQTPSAFNHLSQADRENPEIGRQLSLRVVIFGGEALEPSRLSDWYKRHAEYTPYLINMYGITETTVHVTYYPLAKAIIGSATRSPIGRSISDLQAYVLDENLQLVPIGTAGELYISGEGLARGYLRRPSLTAERFVANPYSPTGERMYRTGDIAKWRADGVLEYLDRSDHQVKIRGFRVELGEIESIIGAHPSVAQVAVLASEDHLGRKYLSCYVVGRTGRANVDVLRKHAIQHLPDYMLPAFYISLTELPLTANG